MRFLETDVDLILLALAVVPIVWSVAPPQQTGARTDVVLVCQGTACYPAPMVAPDKSVNR